jgi:hypothetical protein
MLVDEFVLLRIHMTTPLFPIKHLPCETADRLFLIEPYRDGAAWVFDDPAVGLYREPFVGGITNMIDRLTRGIADTEKGFRLLFADHPFEGYQTVFTWLRTDPIEGNWYRADDAGDEGWLCPALFCYFQAPPPRLYVRAEPKR